MTGGGVRQHRVELLGASVLVRERPGAAPTVLLVHGLGADGTCWDEAFSSTALAGRHLLAPDLPGYGRSGEDPQSRYDVPHLACVVGALAARSRRGARPLLVGHSMGGDVVTCLAGLHPEVCCGVVDIDGAVTDAELFVSGRAARAGEGFGEWFHGFRREIGRAAADDPALSRYQASLALARPEAFRRTSESLVALSAERPMGLRFASLTVPRVFVAALRSISVGGLALLHAHGVEVLELDAHHFVMFERPAEVFRLVASMAASACADAGPA